jgi:hypothetical protein
MWKYAIVVFLLAVVAGLGVTWTLGRIASSDASDRFAALERAALPTGATFELALLEGMPEIAHRYFMHAIAPGTPLRTVVRLRMEGTFLLGDKARSQPYSMSASQILAPPDRFVWIPTMKSGMLEITGSDGLVANHAWTQFWLNGLIPVVSEKGYADLTRSALSRSAMEAVWAPASLLPQYGAVWEQIGPDEARVTFPTGVEPVELLFDTDGSVRQVSTMRWSNANADRTFKLQPFGGTMEAEGTIDGYTIPVRMKVGNHFGTEDYLPFFQVDALDAEYLPR